MAVDNQGARRRGAARAFGVVVLAVVIAAAMPAGASRTARPDPSAMVWSAQAPHVIEAVHTTRRVVALSFDDGPSARWTPTVIDLLAAHDAHATFFLEGQFVAAEPAIARRLVAQGHEVGNHTYTHPDLRTLTGKQVRAELDAADEAFADAGLPAPEWFRAPKGRYDAEADAAVRAAGLTTVHWRRGLCLEKYTRGHSPDEAAALLLARVRPGDILLAHDGGIPNRTATMQALPALLDGLARAGYQVVTIGELLALAERPGS